MRWFVVVALALVLSACGGTEEDPGVASAGGPGANTETSAEPDAQAFTECMRDNGVDLPDPDPDTGLPNFDPQLVGTRGVRAGHGGLSGPHAGRRAGTGRSRRA